MKMIILLSFLVFSSVSWADFEGSWTGWGSWKFKGEDPGVRCSSMKMNWSESKSEISINSGYFECEVVGLELLKTTWSIQSGLLFDENLKQVGSYDGTRFEVFMPSPNSKTTIHILAVRQANHIDYQEIWFNEFEKVYVIQGRLFTGGL